MWRISCWSGWKGGGRSWPSGGALGASPGRIAGQLLLESFVLSLVAAALGLAFADGALHILIAIAPSTLPRLNEIRIDGMVVLFAVGISLAAGLVFGSMAILMFAGGRLGGGLRGAGRSHSAGRERRRAQNALVIVQVGLALVLLISAGLMVRTFRALIHVQPGFTAPPATVQVFRLYIPGTDASRPEEVTRMQQAILQKIEAIPGVSSTSICLLVPLENTFGRAEPVWVRDRAYAEGRVPPLRTIEFTAPGFFRTLGVPVAAGRDFTWSDVYNKRLVVLVSENLAREYWRDPQNAIGKQIRMGATDEWREIVGVVGDVHDNGMNKPAPGVVYWPIMAASFLGQRVVDLPDSAFIIRTGRAGSESFVHEVRRAVRSVDPNLPLVDVDTMADFYRQSMAPTSFSLVMLAVASGMALLLGAIGLFAVISYSVSQRTHDIGVRMALGAQRSDVLRLVLRQGMTLSLMGIGIGAAVAVGVTRFLSNLLYGVRPTDPLTFIAVSLVLISVAVIACYIPARRAAKVDPMVALRHE
jgi:predicted permease